MRKQIILILFLVVSVNLVGQTYTQLRDYTRKSYPDSVIKIVDVINEGETPGDSLLFYCFPSDVSEAVFLFEIDYRQEIIFHGIYAEINRLWTDKCLDEKEGFMLKFISFSDFVDGYFAIDYLIDIKTITESKKGFFLKVLNKCPEEYRSYFLDDADIRKMCDL